MSLQNGRSKHYSLPPRVSSGLRNSSVLSPDTHISSNSSSITGDSQFQMMDIAVSVDVLEGLVMEMKDNQYSFDLNESSSQSKNILGALPVTTFVSCKKNVSSTRSIATHVPSLPLSKPSSTHGGKHHHFLVRWPADYDPYGDALSTFKMSRLMKKESTVVNRGSFNFGYVPEEIELTIGLMRGSEMLTLGLANLVITGEETEEMIIDLPINITKDAVKDLKKTKRSPSPLRKLRSPSKMNAKILKPKSFPSDSKRRYRLSEQSMIRLQVKMTPQSKDSFSEESSEREQIHDSWQYEDSTREGFVSPFTGMEGTESSRQIRRQYDSEAHISDGLQERVFGKELPQFTQDYICGRIDYRDSIDNAYQLKKEQNYDHRRIADMSGRGSPYYGPQSSSFSSSSRNYYEGHMTQYEQSSLMGKQLNRSSNRQRSSSRRYRSSSQSRLDGKHKSEASDLQRPQSQSRSSSRSSSQHRATNYHKTMVQQSSGSRQRSSSHLRERMMPEVEYYSGSYLHERSVPMRNRQNSVQNKAKSLDENRHPTPVSSRFMENESAHSQKAIRNMKPKSELGFHPHSNLRTRQRSPTHKSLHAGRFPSKTPNYDDSVDYQLDKINRKLTSIGHSQRISSMR